MAVWGWSGDRWRRMDFEGMLRNCDVYLALPGPSLADVDPDVLSGPGVVTVAVNKAFPKVPKPDIWIGADHPSCFHPSLLWQPFPKFLRACWHRQRHLGMAIRDCPRTYFVDVDSKKEDVCGVTAARGRSPRFIFAWPNTLEMAVGLLCWMRPRRVFFLGADFGFKNGMTYWDDAPLTDGQKKKNLWLYRWQARRLWHHAIEAMFRGVEFVSCTPESPINTFMPYVPLEKALERSHGDVPKGWSPERHAADMHLCLFSGQKPRDGVKGRGVITGVSDGLAWILPWWYENFRRHNPNVPVCFFEFPDGPCTNVEDRPPGMDKEQRKAWCMERGQWRELNMPEGITGWFAKPFACLATPFETTLWLDVDTEVRKSLTPLFEKTEDYGLVVPGQDVHTWRGHPHSSGWMLFLPTDVAEQAWKLLPTNSVFGFRHGEPVIEEWAQRTVPPREHEYRGDHEIMAHVLMERRPDVAQWASAECSVKRRPTHDDPIVFDYAGSIGKKMIADALKGKSDGNS